MTNYLIRLPDDILQIIDEHRAAIIIQERAFKIFYKRFGPTWKNDVEHRLDALDVYDYDHYAYMNDMMDPWHDYVDDEQLQYPSVWV